jgi:hypothetical protein
MAVAIAPDPAMLRITEIFEMCGGSRPTWTLRLEGALKGEWVGELRRAWRRIRETAAGGRVRVELADVDVVDATAKVLLAEMYRDGVDIVARDLLTAGVLDDIIAGLPSVRRPDSTGVQRSARAVPRPGTDVD